MTASSRWRSPAARTSASRGLINALVRNGYLARTSNTPGRTQELNFFTPYERQMYLVDMPGYGFAQAPKDKVKAWTELVKAYLRGRPTLRRVFVLVDSRHGIKPPDREIMEMLDEAAVSYQVVLTKGDKINEPSLEAMRRDTEKALVGPSGRVSAGARHLVGKGRGDSRASRDDSGDTPEPRRDLRAEQPAEDIEDAFAEAGEEAADDGG